MESPRARRARRVQDSRARSASTTAVVVDARAVIRRKRSSSARKDGEEEDKGPSRRPRVVVPAEPEAPTAALDKSASGTYVYRLPPHSDLKGIFSACTILLLWAAAFYFSHFCVRLTPTPVPAPASSSGAIGSSSSSSSPTPTMLPASPWYITLASFTLLTHLYMGLFVTAHDAMHGAVCGRRWRQLNDWLGASCITCYAFFSYTKLHEEHWRHHHWTGRTKMAAELAAQRQRRGNEVGGGKKGAAATAAEKNLKQQQDHADPPLLRYDPDYHTGNPRLLPWFASFMAHYSSPGQYARIAAATAFLLWLGAPYLNLCLFMCGAAVLAAFQLFYWGTYRPHRPDAAALKAHARAGDAAAAEMPWRRSRSAPWPNPVLFLQAYFFNLHYHHHRWPYCPWWDLPRLRREAGLAGVVPVLGREEGEEAY